MRGLCFLALNLVVVVHGLNFLAIGDWGGAPAPAYHTPGQRQAAEGMGKVAAELNAQFVLALGDNFYFSGVENAESARFEHTWDKVYSAQSLQVPWYVIAGNHDHKGNVSAQIEYTAVDPSSRWQFPSLYHKQSFKDEGGVTMDVILIDTVQLCDMNQAADESVAGYFDPLPPKAKDFSSASSDQWLWIENEMANSKADYLIVGGHFPVYSVCQHGPTQTLIDHLKPLLDKYNAHYLSGHDHCLNHFQEGQTNYVLTGLGDTCCYSTDNLANTAIPAGALKWYTGRGHKESWKIIAGFTSFAADAQAMTITYHDGKGDVLFKADPVPKRVLQMQAAVK